MLAREDGDGAMQTARLSTLWPSSKAKPRPRWVKFAEVPELHAVGKDAVAMRTSCHVVLYDAGRRSTAVHHASGGGKGDGVRCLAGHPTLALFAFAEMCLRPRILVLSYPSLSLVSTLTGKSGGGYLSLVLTETDLAVSLSAYPKFAVTVWSWRKGERLAWQESGLVHLEQSLRCGLGWPTTVCQAAGPGPLLLWEVGVSGKLCGLTRRVVALPGQARHCGLAWAPEELLVVDVAGNVYSVERDGQEALLSLQWSGEDAGATPAVAWFKGGLALSGPDASLQFLKRTADGWTQLWAVKPAEPMVRLGSLAHTDVLLCMSDRAVLYQLQTETERGSELLAVQQYGCSFVLSCVLLPTGEHCLAVGRDGLLTVWETASGAAVAAVHLNHQYLAISPNPIVPYVVLSRPDGALDFISLHNPAEPQVMDQVWLCSERLDDVQFTTSGRLMVAAAKKKGWLFLLEDHAGQRVEVLSRVEAAGPVTDYALLDGGKDAVLLLALLASRPFRGAGREVAVYRKSAESRVFGPRGVAHLCGDYVRLCAVPSGDLSVFAVPRGSKQVHLLRLLDDGSADAVPLFVPFCLKDAPVPRTAPLPDPVLQLVDVGPSCHQLRRFGLSAWESCLLSFGADGSTGLYGPPSLEGRGVFATHHRHSGGVAAASADPSAGRLVCLGTDGSLVGVATNIGEDNSVETPQDAVSTVQVYVPPVQTLPLDTGDPSERRTWLQTQQDMQQMQEAMAVSEEKKKIMDDFLSLQEQLDSLLEANETSPPERQLPVAEFDLDREGRARRLREAASERERVREDALALCRAQDELGEALRRKYWQPMEVKGRVMQSFTSPFVVENYPVMRASGEFEEALKRVVSSRQLELAVHKDFLRAWLPHQPSSPEPEPARGQPEVRRGTVALQRALLEAELEEEEEGEEAAACVEACGSVSHRYVEVPPLRHHQYELATSLQWFHEAVLLQVRCS
ncbi:uncharacterized protein LOC134540305 [Bacillus rossius redtenbacheri]|uniref:uncharacterized protein LOC134540305 n=1 Tax=Bacillus rossius redtenbacheri TaxID=93214 RepID=UPI002FDEAB4E